MLNVGSNRVRPVVKKGNAWTLYLVILVLSRVNCFEYVELMVDQGQRRGYIGIAKLDFRPRKVKLSFGHIHLHYFLW